MNGRPRYKGRIMSEKQYKQRMKQIENGLRRKKQKVPTSDNQQAEYKVEGRRIVDLKVMAQHLYCSDCKEILSLDDVEKEVKKGLASELTVRCRKCRATTIVPTSKLHKGTTGYKKKRAYDINTKAALGAIHSGLGHTSINNFLSAMNIPCMTAKTFKSYEDLVIGNTSVCTCNERAEDKIKSYERETGPIVEAVAKESCIEACEEERTLTMSYLGLLPKDL